MGFLITLLLAVIISAAIIFIFVQGKNLILKSTAKAKTRLHERKVRKATERRALIVEDRKARGL